MIINMTTDEKLLLQEWVNAGNDERGNPWLMAGEDGRPLDFITARRDMLALEAEHKKGL